MALGSIAAEGSSTLSPLTMWLPGSLASRSKPVAGDDAQRLRPIRDSGAAQAELTGLSHKTRSPIRAPHASRPQNGSKRVGRKAPGAMLELQPTPRPTAQVAHEGCFVRGRRGG